MQTIFKNIHLLANNSFKALKRNDKYNQNTPSLRAEWKTYPLSRVPKGFRAPGLRAKKCRAPGPQYRKIGALGLHNCTLGDPISKLSGLQVVKGFGLRAPRQKFLGSRAPVTPPPPPPLFETLYFLCTSHQKKTKTNKQTKHNSVNCDRPGECSPEKDCLR